MKTWAWAILAAGLAGLPGGISAGERGFAPPASFFTGQAWGSEHLRQVSPEGVPFADANKIWKNDSALCWAGVAANLLQAGGWGRAAEREGLLALPHGEDSLLDYFQASWGDVSFRADQGVRWFVDGSSYSQARSGGALFKGRLDTTRLTGALSADGVPPERLWPAMQTLFVAGYGVSLSVHSGATLHEITLWGYEETPDGKRWLFYSNSDDANGGKPYGARETAEKKLTRTELTWDAERQAHWIANRAFRLAEFRFVRRFDRNMLGGDETGGDARPLAAGVSRYGRHDVAGDRDGFRFTAPETGEYRLYAAMVAPAHGNRLRLRLARADGELLFQTPAKVRQTVRRFRAEQGEVVHLTVMGDPGPNPDELLADVYHVNIVAAGK